MSHHLLNPPPLPPTLDHEVINEKPLIQHEGLKLVKDYMSFIYYLVNTILCFNILLLFASHLAKLGIHPQNVSNVSKVIFVCYLDLREYGFG